MTCSLEQTISVNQDTVPHYVLLSPISSPSDYACFLVHWASSIICILVAIHFYRAKQGPWWLLVIAAFAFPLITEVIRDASHGLPPLPQGLETDYPSSSIKQNGLAFSPTEVVKTYIAIPYYPLLTAIALSWAYLAQKKSLSK